MTVSRLRAHSTGVESINNMSSSNPGLWLANMPISHSRHSASRRRRLKYPDCWGKSGNRCPKRLAATAKNRRSDGIPMIAWATHSVTTSASVTLRAAFCLLSGRRSSAVTNTVVSSWSRSASIEAPWVGDAYEHRRLRPSCSLLLENTHKHGHRRGINHLVQRSNNRL